MGTKEGIEGEEKGNEEGIEGEEEGNEEVEARNEEVEEGSQSLSQEGGIVRCPSGFAPRFRRKVSPEAINLHSPSMESKEYRIKSLE